MNRSVRAAQTWLSVKSRGRGIALKNFAKIPTFSAVWKSVFKKNSQEIVDFPLQSVNTGGSLARNARWGSFSPESNVAESGVATGSLSWE